ncbi:MAG TPA: hypothetical protein VGI10_20320 [Polyangiaceae bacterium]|jgi:antitoxin (DNA-binding transcriptional repressor) of toxin-antitoxin stability system
MKIITVRDVRLHWRAAEQELLRAGELVVTRDGTPVARILPFKPRVKARRHFNGRAHLDWLASFWHGKRKGPSTEQWLKTDRDE